MSPLDERWPIAGPESVDPRVASLGKSATLAIQARSASMRAGGQRVYRLGLGQSPFPVPAPVVDALRAHAAQKDYLPVEGLPALREAIAEHHRRRSGALCVADDVLVGPGSKELMFLLQVVHDGEVLVPTPAWVSYDPQARIVGREVQLLETRFEDGYRLDPDMLAAHCKRRGKRPRVLVLNSPSNPTGVSLDRAQLSELAEVARRFGVVVLADDIYAELHFEGRHVSMARLYPEGTILSSGLSKWCGAGGWRLGTFAFPRELRWLLDAMAVVASETFTTTSAPIQYAAVRAFQGGATLERYLEWSRAVLVRLVRWAVDRLRAAGARVVMPSGAFYLFPDLGPLRDRLAARGLTTSRAVAERLLLDTGVASLPGDRFGRHPSELTLRLALVDFDGARALADAASAAAFGEVSGLPIEELCHPTTEAIVRMAAWLEDDRPRA